MIQLQDIILTTIVVHSLTLAIGLFFIYSTQSKINEEILKKNYKLAEKNSLYKFNESLINFLKALIPFYYFVLGLNIIKDSGDYSNTVAKAIASGKYEPIDFENRKKQKEVKVIVPEPKVEFEITKEKFKARKIDSSIYDPTETPIEYSERIMNDELINATPYIDTHISSTEMNESNSIDISKTNNKPNIINITDDNKYKAETALTPKEVASYISKLSESDLIALNEVINELLGFKHNYQRTLEKDIA